MPKVILCLGSNKDPQRHIDAAKDLLRHTVGAIRFSPSLWTEPIGGKHKDCLYLNCLAEGETDMNYPTLHKALKDLERRLGSTPHERANGIVRIDVDILKVGSQRYNTDDWERNYIKTLLAEL